jgi:CubicO group peptidase (beta-lactamase class C family)
VVAGYVVQVRQFGTPIYANAFQFAKTRLDGTEPEPWAQTVRMHVASCSKFVTAIAMTKVLNDRQMSYDTPILPFLPVYWGKGPHIGEITFRHLMTHRSGFDNGDKNDSDFEFMKDRVAAGTTMGPGAVKYENMNFALCRILISTITGVISPVTTFNVPEISNDTMWDFMTINGSLVSYKMSLKQGWDSHAR